MSVHKARVFFPRQFHLMCSILFLYLLIVLHNCKKKQTHISNFMIRLLLLAPTNTISLPLEKANVLLKITKFLLFLRGGFYLKLSGLRKIYLPFKLFTWYSFPLLSLWGVSVHVY